jgi:hypothetical protein
MAEPSIDVDKLVREVLAKLGAATDAGADAARTEEAAAPPAPSRPAPDAEVAPTRSAAAPVPSNGELVVLRQVVTMSELEGRLEGVRRLVVPPQAVVTPSVRDELHRRNVTLQYDQPVPVPPGGSVRLVMVVLGSRFDPAPLTRALQGEGIGVETHRTDCLVAATDQTAAELAKSNTLGLVVSTYPAAALCLANRHQGVRAVLGIDAATVEAEAASVGANVLVVNPRTTSFFQMRQMIGRFCRGGPRECPELLRERLG